MTEDEYRLIVTALAHKHLNSAELEIDNGQDILAIINRLSETARLVSKARKQPDSEDLRLELGPMLSSNDFRKALDVMRTSGVLDALDDAPDPIFRHLTRAMMPEEDVEYLRQAGVEDPEAELALLIYWARNGQLRARYPLHPSQILDDAQRAFYDTAARIESDNRNLRRQSPLESQTVKKRKLFNGVGKLLAGAITGAGNVLLATGTIIAPNPATAYGVIVSSAIAVTSLSAGIGDLRGE